MCCLIIVVYVFISFCLLFVFSVVLFVRGPFILVQLSRPKAQIPTRSKSTYTNPLQTQLTAKPKFHARPSIIDPTLACYSTGPTPTFSSTSPTQSLPLTPATLQATVPRASHAPLPSPPSLPGSDPHPRLP